VTRRTWRALAEQVVAAGAFTICVNVFEAALAVVRERQHSPSAAYRIVLDMAERLSIAVTDYDSDAIPHAIAAREKYGAGGRRLNMGDCLSYGAATRENARLLYVGEDFARTDVNDHV
jgi:ribonuclease VapC